MKDLIGKQLGPFKIVKLLGQGGMGTVYEAYQSSLNRQVALKILPPHYAMDPTFVGRFTQEAETAANLQHPHIVPIFSYGEDQGYHYIAMRLVNSKTSLKDLIRDRPLPLPQIHKVISQIGEALDYAHSQNVIHRDVKPDNILFSSRGYYLLSDFGIAKILESSAHYTQTGASIGTPRYMSPEQIRAKELDGRSDIYSLGVVLYEMATGQPPYQGDSRPAIYVKHLQEPLPSPHKLNPALPQAVVQVITKSLAKKREDRYATAGEMVLALDMGIPEKEKSTRPVSVQSQDQASKEAGVIEELGPTVRVDNRSHTAEKIQKQTAETVDSEALKPTPQAGRVPVVPPIDKPVYGQETAILPAETPPRRSPYLKWGLIAAGGGVILIGVIVVLALLVFGSRWANTPTPTQGGVAAEVPQTQTSTATKPVSTPETPVPEPSLEDTPEPSPVDTLEPTATNTLEATVESTPEPVIESTTEPTTEPTVEPTVAPTTEPTIALTTEPTAEPVAAPPRDLTGWLAIPLMVGLEPKVNIVDLSTGELQGSVGVGRQPDYTRDGASLVVNGDGGALDKLRVIDPIGSLWQEIGDPALNAHSHPVWSPDGTQLIYDDNSLGCGGWCIYKRNRNNNQGEGEILQAAAGPIVDPNPLHPLWTTGDRFIFRGCNTWIGGGDCGIWVMPGNSGTPEKLTSNPNHIPTGVYEDIVVYGSAETGDWNIYTLNITSGATRQLTFDQAADGLATISPDGRSVAFLSNRDGMAVWYVDINGGAPEKLFAVRAEWGQLREDGWSEEKLAWGPK